VRSTDITYSGCVTGHYSTSVGCRFVKLSSWLSAGEFVCQLRSWGPEFTFQLSVWPTGCRAGLSHWLVE